MFLRKFIPLNRSCFLVPRASPLLQYRLFSNETPTVALKETTKKEAALDVQWKDSHSSSFPYLFLRENCLCESCFHPTTKSRVILFRDIPYGIKPKTVQSSENEVVISWPDGHESRFDAEWLRNRSFAPQDIDERVRQKNPLSLWYGNFKDFGNYSFEEVMSNDVQLLKLLQHYQRFGIVLMKNAPIEWGVINKFAAKISYLKKSHYGETYQLVSKPKPVNLAYTPKDLPMHTDLPYLHNPPGVQLLHCLKQSKEGGENLLVDGFALAEYFRKEYPEYFKRLVETKWSYVDVGTDSFEFHYKYDRPVIETNERGEVTAVTFNDSVRDSYSDCSPEEFLKNSEAYYAFGQKMYEPKFVLENKLQPGEILMFNNRRLLHGRRGYIATEERVMEGGYLEPSDISSRINCLKQAVKNKGDRQEITQNTQ